MKTCTKCGERKPFSEFPRPSKKTGWVKAQCTKCTNAYWREWAARNREKSNGFKTAWRLRNPEKMKAAQKSWKIRNPHKLEEYAKRKAARNPHLSRDIMRRNTIARPEVVKARRAVSNAISRGDLIRQPCEVCGLTKVEAHHPDYGKPLDVRWLCHRHHTQLHHELQGEAA